MDAVLRELWMHSTVFCGQWSIEIDKFAVVIFRKSGDTAIHIADRFYWLDFGTPMVVVCRKDSTENNVYIMLFGHLCHCLYVLHYQAIRNVALILRDVVCATADNHAIGVADNYISLKSFDHLRCNLAALSAVYKVIFAEKLRVSAVLLLSQLSKIESPINTARGCA